ncbi:MAG TPA: hypothetical protein VGX51_06110 [Solirubrobacteraceae bacterium]|nr:hypothetical protein [Solirubrobacteraceae bacterium]
MSSEPIATSAQPASGTRACSSCGAVLAEDQRYCLECGERRPPMSGLLAASHPAGAFGPAGAAPAAQPPPTPSPTGDGSASRQNALLVLAGVGVLLLAMGVGVLIGRSSAGKQSSAPAQVVSVASTPAATPAAAEPAFSSDWPPGTSGYTVQLHALPVSSTKVTAVQAAKTAAAAKGAKGVGTLRSEEFSTLKAGSYVIYSGVYYTKAEAEKAQHSLRKSFPAASVIKISGAGGASGATSPGEAAEEAKEAGKGVGQALSKPAPPSVVHSHGKKGRNFERESKNLPNVISTG